MDEHQRARSIDGPGAEVDGPLDVVSDRGRARLACLEMSRADTAPQSIGLADRSTVDDRTFAWNGEPLSDRMRWFVGGLRGVMLEQGYEEREAPGPEVQVVLHHLDPENARPYRRKLAPTFVVALASMPAPPDDVLRAGYPLLVRGLANLCVMVSEAPASGQA